jgi:hypothetical protein
VALFCPSFRREISTPVRDRSATSPSSRNTTLRVYGVSTCGSLARKTSFSSSSSPTTSGEPLRAATSVSGSSRKATAIPHVPRTCDSADRTEPTASPLVSVPNPATPR